MFPNFGFEDGKAHKGRRDVGTQVGGDKDIARGVTGEGEAMQVDA